MDNNLNLKGIVTLKFNTNPAFVDFRLILNERYGITELDVSDKRVINLFLDYIVHGQFILPAMEDVFDVMGKYSFLRNQIEEDFSIELANDDLYGCEIEIPTSKCHINRCPSILHLTRWDDETFAEFDKQQGELAKAP